MNLSERIRQLRLQKGPLAGKHGRHDGFSTSAYGDIKRGRTKPPLSRLQAFAALLEVPLPGNYFPQRNRMTPPRQRSHAC